ncbi:MAG: hypothetical protein KAY37_03475 [Phycisphaerae bacterium]|nr:hypothetical protein [Phycisphaerae bacterium]
MPRTIGLALIAVPLLMLASGCCLDAWTDVMLELFPPPFYSSDTADTTDEATGESGGLGLSSDSGEGTTNLHLMNQAEQLVEADYPNSLLIEANGVPSSGSASTAEGIDRWRFVFVDDISATNVGTVLLEYADGAFGTPEHSPQPWFGTVYERLPREMSLGEAVQKMRDAGYTADFTAVTLRKPLTFPQPEEALYAFSLTGHYVMVGALTGEVTTETAT